VETPGTASTWRHGPSGDSRVCEAIGLCGRGGKVDAAAVDVSIVTDEGTVVVASAVTDAGGAVVPVGIVGIVGIVGNVGGADTSPPQPTNNAAARRTGCT
jgi:hypothetical protein